MEINLWPKIENHAILDQKRVSSLGDSSPSLLKNLHKIPKFATNGKNGKTVNRDGLNSFDGKTEATFWSTLISVSSLIDFLTSVKSAMQFSVKYVEYVNTKLRSLPHLCRLPHREHLRLTHRERLRLPHLCRLPHAQEQVQCNFPNRLFLKIKYVNMLPKRDVWIAQWKNIGFVPPGPGFNSRSRSQGKYKLMLFWARPHP